MSITTPNPQRKLTNSVNRLLPLIAFALVTALLFTAREFLIPIALAILVSFFLAPVVNFTDRRKIPRVPAVICIVLIMLGALIGFGYLLGTQFSDFVEKLPDYRQNITAKMRAFQPDKDSVITKAQTAITDISREMESAETTATAVNQKVKTDTSPSDSEGLYGLAEESNDIARGVVASDSVVSGDATEDDEPDAVPVRVVETESSAFETLSSIFGPVLSILGTAGLVLLFVIFLLLEKEDVRDRILRLSGVDKVRVTTEALDEAARRVSKYLVMQVIINVSYGIPVALGLWLLDVPNAMLWGAMATVLRFIPYAGPWIAAAMPIALSLAVFPDWYHPLMVIGMFVVLEVFSNNVMEPMLYGHTTGVSPLAVIVGVVFWTWLWGAVGLVLAMPLTVCLVVLGRHIPQLAFFHVLLGDEPPLSAEARIYNRLLSKSHDDAIDISEEYLKENGMEALFDEVYIPMLELVDRDRDDGMLSEEKENLVWSRLEGMIQSIDEKNKLTLTNPEVVATAGPQAVRSDESSARLKAAKGIKRVMIVGAEDRSDELAGEMLALLLRNRGHEVQTLSSDKLLGEQLEAIVEFRAESVVLSAVPPLASTQLRYMVKRIKDGVPDARIVLGYWTREVPKTAFLDRIREQGVEIISHALRDAEGRV